MVFACVKGKSSSNCPNLTFREFFGNPMPWPRSLYFSQPSPIKPLALAAPTEMSSSIQNDKFCPKLPALMIVNVFGAKRSVRGVNPFCWMNPAGRLRLRVKFPSYRNAIGRNLARIHCPRECLLLRFRTQQDRGFFYEDLVVFRELESVLLERLPEVVQFRIIVVARRARCLILPRERGDRGSLRHRRKHYPHNDHDRSQTRHDAGINYTTLHSLALQILPRTAGQVPKLTARFQWSTLLLLVQSSYRDERH
jgi:hypothetical protein